MTWLARYKSMAQYKYSTSYDFLEVVYTMEPSEGVGADIYIRWWAQDDYTVVAKPSESFPNTVMFPNNWLLA